jgi:hypothetical protein
MTPFMLRCVAIALLTPTAWRVERGRGGLLLPSEISSLALSRALPWVGCAVGLAAGFLLGPLPAVIVFALILRCILAVGAHAP